MWRNWGWRAIIREREVAAVILDKERGMEDFGQTNDATAEQGWRWWMNVDDICSRAKQENEEWTRLCKLGKLKGGSSGAAVIFCDKWARGRRMGEVLGDEMGAGGND
ncbi:unnamed protein product [Calypogeia fissa]